MQQANPKPAPGSLVQVQDFVNTLNMERELEEFGDAEEARAWLVGHELLGESAAFAEADFQRLIDFREALRDSLAAHNGGSDEVASEVSRRRLNDIARSVGLKAVFERDGDVQLAPAAEPGASVEYAIGTILTIVFRATVQGTWQRLKACRSEDCRWVFYDNTKNRSGAWCIMDVCGARAKMRTYRQRSAAKPS